jgi:hypothetical protein
MANANNPVKMIGVSVLCDFIHCLVQNGHCFAAKANGAMSQQQFRATPAASSHLGKAV